MSESCHLSQEKMPPDGLQRSLRNAIAKPSKAQRKKWQSLVQATEQCIFKPTLAWAASSPGQMAHLYKEVKTVPDGTDRMRYTNHMELFAVINTLQCLEMAYSQDYVNYADYAKACNKLLNQYKVRFRQLASEFHTVEEFASRYKMVCPAALERIKEGRPITMHDSTVTRNMQFVEFAITIMDKLRLNVVSVDVITPDLRNLYDILCKMSVIPDNYTGKDMMQGWLKKLSGMPADANLTASDVRQLLCDIEETYHDVFKFVNQDN